MSAIPLSIPMESFLVDEAIRLGPESAGVDFAC